MNFWMLIGLIGAVIASVSAIHTWRTDQPVLFILSVLFIIINLFSATWSFYVY